jgi:hypothetical protein
MTTNNTVIYEENLTSDKTEALFVALTLVFLLAAIRRTVVRKLDARARVYLFLSVIFLFYAVNYRTLTIRLTAQALTLTFGLFSWTVALDNIEACAVDEVPVLMRLGGAGIHLMSVRKRYRASFNVLEYPRVVIALKRKAGPVRDLSFSTRSPEEILQQIQAAVAATA